MPRKIVPPLHLPVVRRFLRRLRKNAPAPSIQRGALLLARMYVRPAHFKDRPWQRKYFEALGLLEIFRNTKDIGTLEDVLEAELHGKPAIGGSFPTRIAPERINRHWEATLKHDLATDPDYLQMTLEKIQKEQGAFYRPMDLNLKDGQVLRRSLEILYVLLMGMVIALATHQDPSLKKWCWRAMLQTTLVIQETLIREEISLSRLLQPGRDDISPFGSK